MKNILLLPCLLLAMFGQAQKAVVIGPAGAVPDSKIALDIRSTAKGYLPTRLNPAQRTTLGNLLTSTQKGMQVADSATGELFFWSGSGWKNMTLTAALPVTINLASNEISLNAGTKAGDLLTWDGLNWISKQPAAQKFSIQADNRQPYLAVNYFISPNGIFPSPSDANQVFVGQIFIGAFNFAPSGFLPCNGSLLSIAEYDVLFNLIGTTYGGDGQNTFALPDLRGRAPVHFGQGNGLSTYTLGEQFGIEKSTIAN